MFHWLAFAAMAFPGPNPLLELLLASDCIAEVRVTSVVPGMPDSVYGVDVVRLLRGAPDDLTRVTRPQLECVDHGPRLRVGDSAILALRRWNDAWNVAGTSAGGGGEVLIHGDTAYATIALAGGELGHVLEGRDFMFSAPVNDLRSAIVDFGTIFSTGRTRDGHAVLCLRDSGGELNEARGRSATHAYLIESALHEIDENKRAWRASYDEARAEHAAGHRDRSLRAAWRAFDVAEVLGERDPSRNRSLELLVVTYAGADKDPDVQVRLKRFLEAGDALRR